MKSKITPVILSGGAGSRLWPVSTSARPKQFQPLTSSITMFEKTVDRVSNRTLFNAPVLLVSEEHCNWVTEVMHNRGDYTVIAEPCRRNTAPAIALAAHAIGDDAILAIMPSDHEITAEEIFLDALTTARDIADDGWFVTLGIEPKSPETGYGYIELGHPFGTYPCARQVEKFVEKPNAHIARSLVETGRHVWNAGIFIISAKQYLVELRRLCPEIASATARAWQQAQIIQRVILPDSEAFRASPSDSIDYAIMENAEKVACIPVDMGWSDVGSWDALYELSAKDANGNALAGNSFALDSRNNLIRGDGITVATYGIDNLIVVATQEAVIVLPRGESQRVKDLLAATQQKR